MIQKSQFLHTLSLSSKEKKRDGKRRIRRWLTLDCHSIAVGKDKDKDNMKKKRSIRGI